jgi:hypothetical protein
MTDSPFDQVPVESDTHILLQREARFEQWPVLHQHWVWDGIHAESLIFLDRDIDGIDDAALERLVRASTLVRDDSSITLTRRSNGYTFVNFNFEERS